MYTDMVGQILAGGIWRRNTPDEGTSMSVTSKEGNPSYILKLGVQCVQNKWVEGMGRQCRMADRSRVLEESGLWFKI